MQNKIKIPRFDRMMERRDTMSNPLKESLYLRTEGKGALKKKKIDIAETWPFWEERPRPCFRPDWRKARTLGVEHVKGWKLCWLHQPKKAFHV